MGEVLDDVARVLGHVLTGARRYTDRFEMLRRRRELGLAAEIQWELLPSLAFELPAFSIAGTVEPAYEIGGDNFDYAISAHRLTVSVSDAVGHGIRAALLASLAVTAMRNARRAHCRIVEQAGAANRHLVEQFPGADFVTGLILELDVDKRRRNDPQRRAPAAAAAARRRGQRTPRPTRTAPGAGGRGALPGPSDPAPPR